MADDPFEQEAPIELSEKETEVMLAHFAGTSIASLARSTGLSLDEIDVIADKLRKAGLIEPKADEPGEHATFDDAPDPLSSLPPPPADLASLPPSADPSSMPGEPEEACEADAHDDAADVAGIDRTREYRKLFETELHPLPTDQRVALATTATGTTLFALAFDPVPAVVHALLSNVAVTLEHVRLVAAHHTTPRGLEDVAARSAFASDPLVRRRLLRNPATPAGTVRRLMGGRRLLEIYKLSIDRDAPEGTRATARGLFRAKYGTAPPEERVEIVWATEGRALVAMTGLTFDGRTTSVLCSRNYVSIVLVQSLARFPATPPMLIAHLLRQPLVKRQMHLRNQLLAHPNTPSDSKRRI